MPLPSVFGCACNTILDGGAVTTDQINTALERDLEWKTERVHYVWKGGFPELTEDVLAQLKQAKIITQGEDNLWRIRESVPMNKTITVIRGKSLEAIVKSQHGGPHTGFKTMLNPKEVRDELSQASVEQMELLGRYNALRADQDMDVPVLVRGRTTIRNLRVHPLSGAYSRMDSVDFLALAQNIKAHGFTDPTLTLFQGKILDGGHRGAVASAMHIPVQVEEFPGDEAGAQDFVESRKRYRHHLTKAQFALYAVQAYFPKAREQAKEEPCKAAEIASGMSHGLVSRITMERMAPVLDAPRTRASIIRGEIKTVAEARRHALAELGMTEPIKEADSGRAGHSVWRSLGLGLKEIRYGINGWETEGPGERHTKEDYQARMQEILDQAEEMNELINQME